MLGPSRYLLGALEIAALAGFAGLGGWSVRKRWLPRLEGAPAGLAATVVALAILIWSAESLGSFGIWTAGAYLALIAAFGLGLWALQRRTARGPSAPDGRVARGGGGEDDPPRHPSPPATGPPPPGAS